MGKKKSTGSRRRRSAKIDKQAAERAEKMREALQYRRLGYSYEAIGETIGVSQSTAHRYVTDAIRAIPADEAEDVRLMMLDRLDRMLAPLMRQVEEDAADSSTISAILQVEDRRARLLGIYSLPALGDGADAVDSRGALEHRRLLERIIAERPALRPDEGGPLVPIL
jgi:hypothetical protein